MTAHLTLPYNWMGCVDPETCPQYIHLSGDANALNSYPREWVQAFIGNCVITTENNSTAVIEKIEFYDTNGKLHSNTTPALIQNDRYHSENPDYSIEEWYQHGKLHREDGPAVVYANGNKIWYMNNRRHRLDGPAIEYADGTQEWWFKDRLHRIDGPAVVYADGKQEWWTNGTKLIKPPYAGTKAPHNTLNPLQMIQ